MSKKTGEVGLDKITLGVIDYLVSRLDGVLGKTHLQKLLFLSDLMSMKKLRQPITKISFHRYTHGPYSEEVADYTKQLVSIGHIDEREFSFMSDNNKKYTRYYLKKPMKIKEFLLKQIGADKMIVLDEVIDSYGNISLQNLLDIVYNLPVMKKAEMNQVLDLSNKGQEESGEDISF